MERLFTTSARHIKAMREIENIKKDNVKAPICMELGHLVEKKRNSIPKGKEI